MPMQLIPTQAGIGSMKDLGLQWGDVLRLQREADREQPSVKDPTRRTRQLLSGDYILFIVQGTYEGETCLYLKGISPKRVYEPTEESTLFAEQATVKSRKKGGSGSTMPRSFEEILKRIDDAPGWERRMGGKHISVHGPAGERFTIPISSSDWRAVMNATHQLKRLGLDVRRKVS